MASPKPAQPAAGGLPLLRLLLVVGAVATYGVLWGIVFWKIWDAGDGPAPDISRTVLYVIGVLGGILATSFATALGIERLDQDRDPRTLALGSTVIGTTPARRGKATATATLAVWLYAVIGAWGLLTVLVHQDQSPSDVKTAAAAFATAVSGLVAGSLTPGER